MDVTFMFQITVICFGIHLSLARYVSNNCSRLSYDEPAVVGRNVTITFEPVQVDSTLSVMWKTSFEETGGWNPVNEQWNYHMRNLSLVINTTANDQESKIYVQYGSCRSEAIQLKLEVIDNSTCGLWYRKTRNVRLGGTMELSYFPTWNIINTESNYVRIFTVLNDSCGAPYGCEINNLTGVYEIRSIAYNHEHVLSIILSEEFVNGRYRVQCTSGRIADKFTDYIEVTIPVRPNGPAFINTQRIEECDDCLVGTLGQQLEVKCYISGGTAPLEVNIYVGLERLNATRKKNGLYVANVSVTADRHMADVNCSVLNLALNTPLVTESRLYAVVPPEKTVFEVSEARDDRPSTFPTCTSRAARPQSSVTLKVDNGDVIVVNMTTVTENDTYTTSVTPLRIRKNWNLHNLTCCIRHVTYNTEQCESKQLIYKFEPEFIMITNAANHTELLPSYVYNITCDISEAYPACSVTWTVPEEVHTLSNTTSYSGTGAIKTKSVVSLNVSKDDNGERLTCTAMCADIGVNKSAIHEIQVPYAPTISFNVSWPELKISEGDTIVIKCTATWASTVIWLASENYTAPRVRDCGPGAACLILELVTKKHGGRYTCLAQDRTYNVSEYIDITVQVHRGEQTSADVSGPNSGTIIMIAGIVAGFVILVVAIAAFVILKRRKSAKSTQLQSSADRARHAPVGGENISYRQVDQCEDLAARSNDGPAKEDGMIYQNSAYADQGPSSPSMQIPNTQDNERSVTDGETHKELVYADLDLEGEGDSKSNSQTIIGTNETEYVDIDFTKKAAPEPAQESDHDDDENIYMNK